MLDLQLSGLDFNVACMPMFVSTNKYYHPSLCIMASVSLNAAINRLIKYPMKEANGTHRIKSK